jgi:hypothetical protein
MVVVMVVGLAMYLNLGSCGVLEGRGLDRGKAASPILGLIHRRQRRIALVGSPHVLANGTIWTDVVLNWGNLAGILRGGALCRSPRGVLERQLPLL